MGKVVGQDIKHKFSCIIKEKKSWHSFGYF